MDKKTRFLNIVLLSTKKEALQAFKDYKAEAENNPQNFRIRKFHTDGGKEYINTEFDDFLRTYGITHEVTAAYTKEPNGIIERINLTLLNKVKAILYLANLPRYY